MNYVQAQRALDCGATSPLSIAASCQRASARRVLAPISGLSPWPTKNKKNALKWATFHRFCCRTLRSKDLPIDFLVGQKWANPGHVRAIGGSQVGRGGPSWAVVGQVAQNRKAPSIEFTVLRFDTRALGWHRSASMWMEGVGAYSRRPEILKNLWQN
jgi:hypothetical protein